MIGEVQSFDLYGKAQADLFIELKIENQTQNYPVIRNAAYILSKDKYMLITPEEKVLNQKHY